MIFVIDDDRIMANCIADAVKKDCKVFSNAIDAMNELSFQDLPKLIFLDVLLDGPDGFTFLNELASYTDTARIPIVIVTSLDLDNKDLATYGVVGVLKKEEMTPQDIKEYVDKYE